MDDWSSQSVNSGYYFNFLLFSFIKKGFVKQFFEKKCENAKIYHFSDTYKSVHFKHEFIQYANRTESVNIKSEIY